MYSWKSPVEVSTLNKIGALYTNEMIKISRKISVWIMVGLIILASIAAPFLVKRIVLEYRDAYTYETIDKTTITKERDSINEQFGDSDSYLTHATLQFNQDGNVVEFFATLINLPSSLYEEYSKLSMYNVVLANYDFDRYPINDTILSRTAYTTLRDSFSNITYLNVIPFEERDDDWLREYTDASIRLETAQKALLNHDADALADLLQENADSSSRNSITSTFYGAVLVPALRAGTFGDLSPKEAMDLIGMNLSIQSLQDTVDTGVLQLDYASFRPLSETQRHQYEDKITILNYMIEHNNAVSSEKVEITYYNIFSLNLPKLFLILLLIIVAGSSIAQEMATGSIKSLIIAPVKRWKIFTAKLLSIFTWIFFGSFLIISINTLMNYILLGSEYISPYYYVSGGTVKSIPYMLFMFLYFLVDNLSLIVYILAAFMISCLSKNTGLAVGITTGLFLGNSFTSSFFQMIGQKRWIDFLPSSNMNLTKLVFPNLYLFGDADMSGLSIAFGGNANNSLSFSLIYLTVLVLILLLTAYDGFVKKDIQ